MKIIWTRKANTSFNGIVDYLLKIWTMEIAINFVDIVDHTIILIAKNPEMFKVSEYDKISRAAFITKHTTMFYRILDDTIEIEFFWGNFDNPEKINELLKFK
ncbi:type II toxin-antitoxin system RelE/ParE family toxin [Maribacter sp. ACAM166]|uniref:type II toxin-antitoxin system RelE/ParE family toxin n=1 Tax=Maribacter sp. ACAM166 TaxID=2508996 RepID=UPI0010FF5EDB|nr:type II toxin-antitoxin system RelE/ParE family toxin [Maribacter sp. ACAM166]TLP79290.1 type II toxin-antitoxin system RelE/ParE family toxin [Maribacter sp. ACAM166]